MDPKQDNLRRAVSATTRWVGSPQSVVLHTVLFIGSFAVAFIGWIDTDRMLLILTTIVSLEAIYLSLFIQMTVNYQQQSLEEVGQDIEEIQEDIDEIAEDVDEIAEDVDEIAEDVDEIQEDVSEMSEEDAEEEAREQAQDRTLEEIRGTLGALMKDLERLQNRK
jgi:low affinity Fe/Cu permease